MTNLLDLIADETELAGELPLIHTSRCEYLDELVNDAQLTPRHCPVFEENLIYFFYGRPAYRSKHGEQPGEPISLCPVCFVFKPNTVNGIVSRVFPCDTGAIKGGLFKPYLTEDDIDDIELAPQIESARRLIPMFFGTNNDYFIGKIRSDITVPVGGTADKWHKLQCHVGPVIYDDRKSAIEVQVSQPIDFTDKLLYVILPREFLDDDNIFDAIVNKWGCTPLTYPTFGGAPPSDGYPMIRGKIADKFQGDLI